MLPFDRDTLPNSTGSSIWPAVSKWLPPRDEHMDYWWNFSGPHITRLFSNAKLSHEKQWEYTLFYYHYIVPTLGHAPSPNANARDSGLSLDGTNFEYSWRWNQDQDTDPEIRLVIEPFSRFAGTLMDPLNLNPSAKLLYNMAAQQPSIDLSLYHYFIDTFYDHPRHKYLDTNERSVVTNVCLGFEFLKSGILPKAYFFPRKLGHEGFMPLEFWEKAVRTGIPNAPALDAVFSFVRNAPQNELTLTPIWLAIDLIKSTETRVKFYCCETRTSFNSIRKILTMDGAIDITQVNLDAIWELSKGVCGLSPDFPTDQDMPQAPKYDVSKDGVDTVGLWGTFAYYFDIGPNQAVPDIKFYIPVCYYGPNDQVVAEATISWMKKHGRAQFIQEFEDSLISIVTHRRLQDGKGIQMWVSFMVKEGQLQVTTYIAPEGHHPERHRVSTMSSIATRVTTG